MIYYYQIAQEKDVFFVKVSDVQRLVTISASSGLGLGQDGRNKLLRQIGIEPGAFYQELEMSSELVDTHQDSSEVGPTVHLHSHDFHELIFCKSVSGVDYLVGADRYRLQRGDLIMIPAGISHRPLMTGQMSEPYVRYVIWLNKTYVDGMQRYLPISEIPVSSATYMLRTAGNDREVLERLFRQGVEESERKRPGWELAVIANTTQMMLYIYRMLQARNAEPLRVEKPELLERVLAYMEENMTRKLSLEEVAKHFFVSESTISQTFRQKMGVSFHRCLNQRRLIAAKMLISEGIPLEGIGEQVGFTDYSTFYRAFKQEFGISPRQYRKLLEP